MVKYMVWQVECPSCETVISFGEDEGSIPEDCPDCGYEEWYQDE